MTRLLALRAHALENLGLDNIPGNSPVAELEKVFVPVYLMHRYQLEAVAKQIGGLHYNYAVKNGYDSPAVRPVDADEQLAAVRSIVSTLSPENLTVPKHLRELIPPPAIGYGRDRELFRTRNGGGFDPLAMAEAYADQAFKFLLAPERLARVAGQFTTVVNGEEATDFFTLSGYLDEIEQFYTGGETPYATLLQTQTLDRYVTHLARAAADGRTSPAVRETLYARIYQLLGEQDGRVAVNGRDAGGAYLEAMLMRFVRSPETFAPAEGLDLPDGSPIGCH